MLLFWPFPFVVVAVVVIIVVLDFFGYAFDVHTHHPPTLLHSQKWNFRQQQQKTRKRNFLYLRNVKRGDMQQQPSTHIQFRLRKSEKSSRIFLKLMIFILYICFIHPISIKKQFLKNATPNDIFDYIIVNNFMTFSVRQMDVMKFNIFSDLLGLYIYIYYIYIYPKKTKCKQANVVDDDDEEEVQKNMSTKQRNV